MQKKSNFRRDRQRRRRDRAAATDTSSSFPWPQPYHAVLSRGQAAVGQGGHTKKAFADRFRAVDLPPVRGVPNPHSPVVLIGTGNHLLRVGSEGGPFDPAGMPPETLQFAAAANIPKANGLVETTGK